MWWGRWCSRALSRPWGDEAPTIVAGGWQVGAGGFRVPRVAILSAEDCGSFHGTSANPAVATVVPSARGLSGTDVFEP